MRVILVVKLIFIILVSQLFSQSSPILENLQNEISGLIQFVKYSVVTVSAKSSHSYMVEKDEGPLSFLRNHREEKKDNWWTVGSGIIYREDGYLITRANILADFETISVTLCDETKYEAQYIGTDLNTGLAILKINGNNLKAVRKGDSDKVSLYTFLMVLGNSMGISPIASFGMLNGFTNDGLLILSAPINPGNIGGAVFNLKGEIIGIIAAQLATDVLMPSPMYLHNSYKNGIALPINRVCQMADEIIKMHQEQKVWLGIVFDLDSLRNNKLILKQIIPGSPADRAGLKEGDQLLKYNESDLYNQDTIAKLIEQTKPGTSVSINFIRNNRLLKVFPRIERKWPSNFNPYKPQDFNVNLTNQDSDVPVQFPIILSPEKLQQINSKMMRMENEIQRLKSQLKK